VDKALLAAGRLANPHGQAVLFEKNDVFPNASQAVAHARFNVPRGPATPVDVFILPIEAQSAIMAFWASP
jgi:hypothetical protein